MPMVATATAMQPAATPGAGPAGPPVLKMQEDHICCNPFRIPRHFSRSNLRVVPDLIRERLPRVSFTGPKICDTCRNRVHLMLKERRYLKPSPRLSEPDRRKSEPHRRSSDIVTTPPPLVPAAASPKITSLQESQQPNPPPVTAVGVEEKVSQPTETKPSTAPVQTVPLTVTVEVVEKRKKEEKVEEFSQPGTSTSTQGCSSIPESPNLTGTVCMFTRAFCVLSFARALYCRTK